MCFRVLVLGFVFVGCFDEICVSVLALWSFWIRKETPAITPLQFAPKKGRGLGQASRRLDSPCSKYLTPAALRAALRAPDQRKKILCVPEGAPALSHKTAGHVALVPKSEFTEPPFAEYPGPAAALLPSLFSAAASPLAPGQCASDLPDSRRVRPRAGSRPRSRWQTSSEDTELTLRP